MKELVFKKSECESYKDFYEKICVDLKLEEDMDLCNHENLGYSGDLLNEFLWGVHDWNIVFRFIGYDREKVKDGITHEDYRWNIIFEVVEEFVKQYPNNKIEFVD